MTSRAPRFLPALLALLVLLLTAACGQPPRETTTSLPPVTVAESQLIRQGSPFRVFGVQDLDQTFRQAIYIQGDSGHLTAMRARMLAVREYGTNTLRLHLQLFDFVERSEAGVLRARPQSFDNLLRVRDAAGDAGIYLLLSANNTWMPAQVPAWYDAMTYRERWTVQAFFLSELARTMGTSPVVLGYELMSEPVIRRAPDAPWYCGWLEGYAFGQAIARGVPREEQAAVVREWILQLTAAVRAHDPQALLTIGAVGSFYDGPLGVDNTAPLLDFLSPHIYPAGDDPASALTMVARYASAGKPVVVGETHLFRSNEETFRAFLDAAAPQVNGFISFFHETTEPLILAGGECAPDVVVRTHAANQRVMREMCARILGPAE